MKFKFLLLWMMMGCFIYANSIDDVVNRIYEEETVLDISDRYVKSLLATEAASKSIAEQGSEVLNRMLTYKSNIASAANMEIANGIKNFSNDFYSNYFDSMYQANGKQSMKGILNVIFENDQKFKGVKSAIVENSMDIKKFNDLKVSITNTSKKYNKYIPKGLSVLGVLSSGYGFAKDSKDLYENPNFSNSAKVALSYYGLVDSTIALASVYGLNLGKSKVVTSLATGSLGRFNIALSVYQVQAGLLQAYRDKAINERVYYKVKDFNRVISDARDDISKLNSYFFKFHRIDIKNIINGNSNIYMLYGGSEASNKVYSYYYDRLEYHSNLDEYDKLYYAYLSIKNFYWNELLTITNELSSIANSMNEISFENYGNWFVGIGTAGEGWNVFGEVADVSIELASSIDTILSEMNSYWGTHFLSKYNQLLVEHGKILVEASLYLRNEVTEDYNAFNELADNTVNNNEYNNNCNIDHLNTNQFISCSLFKLPVDQLNYNYNNWGDNSHLYSGTSGHAGIDMQTKDVAGGNPKGKLHPFYSLSEGTVIAAKKTGTYHLISVYNSSRNTSTIYLHANSIDVNVGDYVHVGDRLGVQGSKGANNAWHVHVEVRNGQKYYAALNKDGTIDPIDNLLESLENRLNPLYLSHESPIDYRVKKENFVKTWTFNQNIEDLDLEIISNTYTNNISENDFNFNDNKLSVNLTPNHSKSTNKLELRFKKNGHIVKVGKSDTFWALSKTNYLPKLADGQVTQLVSASSEPAFLEIKTFDRDGDNVVLNIEDSAGGYVGIDPDNNNRIFASFSDGKILHKIKVGLFDGKEKVIKEFNVLQFNNSNIENFYSDVSKNGNYLYDGIAFGTLQGIVWGQEDPNNNQKRIFRPTDNASLAEVLAVIIKSEKKSGLIDLNSSTYYMDTYPSWAMPYYTYAIDVKAIYAQNADIAAIEPTREEVAKILIKTLAMGNLEILNYKDISFSDESEFSNKEMLYFGQVSKALGLFMTESAARPKDKITRAELAYIINKIFMIPQAKLTLSPRNVNYGEEVSVVLEKNKIRGISGIYTIYDTESQLEVQLISNNKSLNFSSTIPSENIGVDGKVYAILDNGGVKNIVSDTVQKVMQDYDKDGIPDIEDAWKYDRRYSADTNGNQIPDILDDIFGLQNKTANDTITLNGKEWEISTLIQKGGLVEVSTIDPNQPTTVLSAQYIDSEDKFKISWNANNTQNLEILYSYDQNTWNRFALLNLDYYNGSSNTGQVNDSKLHNTIYFKAVSSNGTEKSTGRVLTLSYSVQTPNNGGKDVEMPARAEMKTLKEFTRHNYVYPSWYMVKDSYGNDNAVKYEVSYADNYRFENDTRIMVTTGRSVQIPNLTDDTRYYFRVRAINNVGIGEWSSYESTTIDLENTPILDTATQTPLNGSTDIGKTPVLKWNSATDKDGDIIEYRVEFGENRDNLNYSSGWLESITEYNVETAYDKALKPNTTYYWRVVYREKGRTPEQYGGSYLHTPVWSFTTVNQGSDLGIESIQLSGKIIPDSRVNFNITVKNYGSETADKTSIKPYYIKNGKEFPFRYSKNITMSKNLNPGESDIVSMSVDFLSDLVTYNGVTYDNILIDGNSAIKFKLEQIDNDTNIANNIKVFNINYSKANNLPVISTNRIYLNNASKYFETFQYNLGWKLNHRIVADDDMEITKITIEYRTNDNDTWHLAQTFMNNKADNRDYMYIQNTDWQIPVNDDFVTDSMLLRVKAYNSDTTYTSQTTKEFVVYTNEDIELSDFVMNKQSINKGDVVHFSWNSNGTQRTQYVGYIKNSTGGNWEKLFVTKGKTDANVTIEYPEGSYMLQIVSSYPARILMDNNLTIDKRLEQPNSPSLENYLFDYENGIPKIAMNCNGTYDNCIIYRQEYNNEFQSIGNVIDPNDKFVDENIQYGSVYRYRAVAEQNEIISEASSVITVNAIMNDDYDVLMETPNYQTLTSNEINIQYRPNKTVSYELYEVLIGTNPNELFTYDLTPNRNIQVSGLEYAKTYYVEIYPLSPNGKRVSTLPAKLTFTTGFDNRVVTQKAVISIDEVGTDHVSLSWDSVANADSYIVCRSENNALFECLESIEETSYVDSINLEQGKRYKYVVKASNDNGFTVSDESIAVLLVSPDMDNDGIPDNLDPDIDGDGIVNAQDAFPRDPTEWLDTDGDGVGNNADTDDDNDGVPDANDDLPLNPHESIDTDGDGIGNNADRDDDNDGISDVDEIKWGFDPLDASDGGDTDADGDGVSNKDEIEAGSDPLDPDDTKKPKRFVPIMMDDITIMIPQPQ